MSAVFNTCIFNDMIDQLTIDEERISNYSVKKKFTTLTEELKLKGVLIASLRGHNIPSEDSIRKISERDIYPWVESENQPLKNIYLMVLGTGSENDQDYVYVVKSDDKTNGDSSIRTHEISKIDAKIYEIAHASFSNKLVDLFLPELSPILTNVEEEFLQQLQINCSVSDSSTVLKKLGQTIFDKFKTTNNDNSYAGMEVLKKIFSHLNEESQINAVNNAWLGVGDINCQWN